MFRNRSVLRRLGWVFPFCLVLVGACAKKTGKGNRCDLLAPKYLELVHAEVEAMQGDEKRDAESVYPLLPKMATELVGTCKKQAWPPEIINCFLGANSAKAFRSECKDRISSLGKPAQTPSQPQQDER